MLEVHNHGKRWDHVSHAVWPVIEKYQDITLFGAPLSNDIKSRSISISSDDEKFDYGGLLNQRYIKALQSAV